MTDDVPFENYRVTFCPMCKATIRLESLHCPVSQSLDCPACGADTIAGHCVTGGYKGVLRIWNEVELPSGEGA